MGKFFKPKSVSAPAPVEPETPGEVKHVEQLSNPEIQVAPQTAPQTATPEQSYREVPVCLSQAQVNNLIIENNMMLKQIIAEMDS